MTCRDVHAYWNRRLDAVRAGSEPATDLEAERDAPSELRAHLERCPSCRARHAAFETLSRAIGALEPPPEPSSAQTAAVLEAWRTQAERSTGPFRPALGGRRRHGVAAPSTAAAAAALVIALLTLRPFGSESAPGPKPRPEPPRVAKARPLAKAVSDVARATVSTARRGSEPAARWSREVLDSASIAMADDDSAERLPDAEAEVSADEVLQAISEQVKAGVRPLTRPTRSAFGFLVPRLRDRHPDRPADRLPQGPDASIENDT